MDGGLLEGDPARDWPDAQHVTKNRARLLSVWEDELQRKNEPGKQLGF